MKRIELKVDWEKKKIRIKNNYINFELLMTLRDVENYLNNLHEQNDILEEIIRIACDFILKKVDANLVMIQSDV